jgi:hypothetical protein
MRLAMDQCYEDANSLFVRAYDAFYVGGAPIGGDIAFGILQGKPAEACLRSLVAPGASRSLWLLEVTGVDVSEGMLSVAGEKRLPVLLPAAASYVDPPGHE